MSSISFIYKRKIITFSSCFNKKVALICDMIRNTSLKLTFFVDIESDAFGINIDRDYDMVRLS